MRQLAILYFTFLGAAVFLGSCAMVRKTAAVDEPEPWDNIVLDRQSIVLKIANDDTHIAEGKALFKQYCSICHGHQGQGEIGPNLTDEYWLHGGTKLEIARTITYGVRENGMQSWQSLLRPGQVGKLVAFVSSLQGTNPANPKAPQGEKL